MSVIIYLFYLANFLIIVLPTFSTTCRFSSSSTHVTCLRILVINTIISNCIWNNLRKNFYESKNFNFFLNANYHIDITIIRSLRWICFLISLPLEVALCPDPDRVDPADPIELLFELLSRWFLRNSLTKLAESHRVSWENRCFMWSATSAERLLSMMEINCCRSGRTRSNSSLKGFFSNENC